jgi:hypothetical protein
MASQGYRIYCSRKKFTKGFNIGVGPPLGCTETEALHAVVTSNNRVIWSPNLMPIRYVKYYFNIKRVKP